MKPYNKVRPVVKRYFKSPLKNKDTYDSDWQHEDVYKYMKCCMRDKDQKFCCLKRVVESGDYFYEAQRMKNDGVYFPETNELIEKYLVYCKEHWELSKQEIELLRLKEPVDTVDYKALEKGEYL